MLREEFLKPLGLTQVEVAERLGVPLQRLNEIVRGVRGVTPSTALRLERAFGMSAHFWLTLQATYDMHRTLSEERSEIDRIVPYPDDPE